MKNIAIILLAFLFQSAYAQVDNSISIFHRLLILNAKNEVMIVKIENTDIWVTPGLYQNNDLTIKQGLDNISSTYGLETGNTKLNGVFILKRDINGVKTTSLRNIYTSVMTSSELIIPEGIDVAKWVSIEEATQLITFPHISVMIEQVVSHPGHVWGGTLLQFKEEDMWKTKTLEEFYVLSE